MLSGLSGETTIKVNSYGMKCEIVSKNGNSHVSGSSFVCILQTVFTDSPYMKNLRFIQKFLNKNSTKDC